MRTRQALVLALSASAVAVPLLHAPATASPGAAPPALTWQPCAKPGGPAGQECAELPVPLDYRDPDGPRLTIAVSRLRSERPSARRGTLIVIPGGPGASGVQRLTQKGNALSAALDGAYDIVSMDPRGVGGSTKASCDLDEDDRHLVNIKSWPGPGGDLTENVARARRTAAACDRNGGGVLRSFTTLNEARDIDLFRRALGEERLSAWSTSYGAYVAAVYAQKYPGHTDRWVLDSSNDPDPERVARGWLANWAQATDDRFPDFAAWAADPARESEGLRLSERAGDVRPLFLDLAARLDRAPKESTTAGVPLTGNRLRQSMHNALSSDTAFPSLARLVKQALDPKATPVLTPDVAGPLPNEDAAVATAVVCNDVRWPRKSLSAYERAVAIDRARHPLTAGMPQSIWGCAFWDAPAEQPTRITDDGPSNILMVQNRRDPATPHFAGLKMRQALGDRARFVTVESGGHGVYLGTGNSCGDRTVTGFLTTGHRPHHDTTCAA